MHDEHTNNNNNNNNNKANLTLGKYPAIAKLLAMSRLMFMRFIAWLASRMRVLTDSAGSRPWRSLFFRNSGCVSWAGGLGGFGCVAGVDDCTAAFGATRESR